MSNSRSRSASAASGSRPSRRTISSGTAKPARWTPATSGFIHDPELGEANRRIIYCETYFRVDMDGYDVAELRKICTIGDQYHVVKTEPADSKPFAFFSPDPEPHTMLGGSWYDLLKDTQLIDSQLLRG